MLTKFGIAFCVLSVTVPAVAMAQTPPPQPPAPPVNARVIHDTMPGLPRVQSEAFNRALTAQASTSPARAARAERVAALINEGRCDDAVALARTENDRRLARRAAIVCESLAAPDAAAQ